CRTGAVTCPKIRRTAVTLPWFGLSKTIEEMMIHPNPLADAALTETDDQALVRLVQPGSKEALDLLINRHQRWIYNIALRMVCLPQDAEDATQEILIKALTKLSTFRGTDNFEPGCTASRSTTC